MPASRNDLSEDRPAVSFRSFFKFRLPFSAPRNRGSRRDWPESNAPETVFTHFYRTNRWRDRNSRSGRGSNLLQTEVIRQAVPRLIRDLGCKSLVDAPCGDFFWMSRVELEVECYWGVDIVAALVENNQTNYGNDVRHFLKLDILSDSLPNGDLVLCRDCLVHFPHADVFRALRNFRASGSVYLLTTTFTARHRNADIALGRWRPLNLQADPFCFPPPLRLINEGCTEHRGRYADKSLGLWKLADLTL